MAPEPSSDEFRQYIDRLVVSGRRVFGWGWAAHTRLAVMGVKLHLESEHWRKTLNGSFGHARPDVEDEHPQLVNPAACGFVLTGFIPDGEPRKLTLEVEFDDGTRTAVDITSSVARLGTHGGRLRRVSWLARAVWRRLKRGDFAGIVRRAKAQHFAAPSLGDAGTLRELLQLLAAAREVCILVDNNMGGGSNQYRRATIAERVLAGQAVLLCTYNLPALEYRLHLHAPGEAERVYRVSSFLVLEKILEKVPVAEIFVNSPVSFDEPLILAEWLARMRAEYPRMRLTVTAHDFFSVCPSFVLLNAEGRFCGIPDLSTCSACLKRHQGGLVALSPPSEIGPWRALWGRCLESADEVRCFSESTRELLMRAYPALSPAKATVVPHRMDYFQSRPPRLDFKAPLVVGIVGEITFQKGALVVQEMVQRIERLHPSVRVVVLGTLDSARRSPNLEVTGAYKRAELVRLIESHGINMFLFPSIWPETFSYVVGELTLLGVPIVAFDLGAPAERLRHYANARLCAEVSPEAALAALIEFHRELGMDRASAA